jgi:hypothetical protein
VGGERRYSTSAINKDLLKDNNTEIPINTEIPTNSEISINSLDNTKLNPALRCRISQLWDKLSNFGELLKLLIPSNS